LRLLSSSQTVDAITVHIEKAPRILCSDIETNRAIYPSVHPPLSLERHIDRRAVALQSKFGENMKMYGISKARKKKQR
jgi:hypothetical protein